MVITHYVLNAKIRNQITIAVVADLHGTDPTNVIKAIEAERLDIITIVGDLVDKRQTNFIETYHFLDRCSSISSTFMSLGNHEFILSEKNIAQITEKGVHVLDNTWIHLENGLAIGGLTSAYVLKYRRYRDEKRIVMSDLQWLSDFEKLPDYKILLDHHPENYGLYTRNMSIDLILSGHNHGGQIRLFGRGLYAANQGIFPRYSGGLYDDRLVVSRGLANTKRIPRINNPTELVFVTLNPKVT